MTKKASEHELKEGREKMKNEFIQTVIKFEGYLKKFEQPLFNIKSHPNIPREKRNHMIGLYEELNDHMENNRKLHEELRIFETYDQDTQNAILEIGEKVLTASYDFIKSLPDNLNAD